MSACDMPINDLAEGISDVLRYLLAHRRGAVSQEASRPHPDLAHVALIARVHKRAQKTFSLWEAVLSKYSVGPLCSGSVVEAEHSTDALPSPYHCAGCCQGRPTFDQVVPETLMVAFSVIVRHVLADRPA